MTDATAPTNDPTGESEPTKHVVIERTFDAPLDLIWSMWTDAEPAAVWLSFSRLFAALMSSASPIPNRTRRGYCSRASWSCRSWWRTTASSSCATTSSW